MGILGEHLSLQIVRAGTIYKNFSENRVDLTYSFFFLSKRNMIMWVSQYTLYQYSGVGWRILGSRLDKKSPSKLACRPRIYACAGFFFFFFFKINFYFIYLLQIWAFKMPKPKKNRTRLFLCFTRILLKPEIKQLFELAVKHWN